MKLHARPLLALALGALLPLSLALGGCSKGADPDPNPGPPTTTAPAEDLMFKKGEVSYGDFLQAVDGPNKAIRTLHYKSTSTTTPTEGLPVTSLLEGEVDQSTPEAPSYQLEASSSDYNFSLVAVGPRTWMKSEGEEWQEYDGLDVKGLITTSYDLFEKLSELNAKGESAVETVTYEGLDRGLHKFVVTLDFTKLQEGDTGAVGTVPCTFLFDGERRMVSQTLQSTSEAGGLTLVVEQSAFDQPLAIQPPA